MKKTVLAGVATTVLFAAYACSNGASSPPSPSSSDGIASSGSVKFALDLTPGVTVDTVNYQITGSDFSPINGSLPVGNAAGSTFVAVINGVPPGTGRTIALTATASNGTTCAGSATFDVVAGIPTAVSVVLECRNSSGTVIVGGSLNQCPLIDSLSAAPGEAAVGDTIAVQAVVHDANGRPLSLAWASNAGTFSSTSAAATTYRCTASGTQSLTVNVSEADGSCKDSASIQVDCTGGGDAGSGGAGGATGGTTGSGGASSGGTTSTGGMTASGGASTGGTTSTGGATASGGANTGGAATGGTDAGTGVNIAGTWISEIKTAGNEMVPIVGSTAANIDLVIRLAVTESAGTLDGQLDICRLNATTTPNASSLVVTFTPAVLATLMGTGTEPAFTAKVGEAVPFPSITILSGVNASGTSVDADSDGHPGVTIPSDIGGLISLDAYVGLTIKTTLTSTLTDADTITGTTNFSTNGTVFGSNNTLLTSGTISVTPSSTAVPFTATRLDGDVPCSQVLTHF